MSLFSLEEGLQASCWILAVTSSSFLFTIGVPLSVLVFVTVLSVVLHVKAEVVLMLFMGLVRGFHFFGINS